MFRLSNLYGLCDSPGISIPPGLATNRRAAVILNTGQPQNDGASIVRAQLIIHFIHFDIIQEDSTNEATSLCAACTYRLNSDFSLNLKLI